MNNNDEVDIIQFLQSPIFTDTLKSKTNTFILDLNCLAKKYHDYDSHYEYLKDSDSQPKASYTKDLSRHIESFTSDVLRDKFVDVSKKSETGYDIRVKNVFLELKCSNNVEGSMFNNFSGNSFQVEKCRCDYYLLLSYEPNEVTGFIDSLAGVYVKNTSYYKTYYDSLLNKANKTEKKNSAQLSIKIPVYINEYKLQHSIDFWCINCKYSSKGGAKGNQELLQYRFIHNSPPEIKAETSVL
jgi:hypothetical protein